MSSGDEEEKNEPCETRKQKTPQIRSKKANALANPVRGYESENEKSIDSATTSSTLIPIRLQSKAGQSVAAGEQTPKQIKKN